MNQSYFEIQKIEFENKLIEINFFDAEKNRNQNKKL